MVPLLSRNICTEACLTILPVVRVLLLQDKSKQQPQSWYNSWQIADMQPFCLASFMLNLQIQKALRKNKTEI